MVRNEGKIMKTENKTFEDPRAKFDEIVQKAENWNKRRRERRFFPISESKYDKESRGFKVYTIGMYDSWNKKYEIVELHHHSVDEILVRLEQMIR